MDRAHWLLIKMKKVIFILIGSFLITPISVYAYLDPGTGSMIIQLLIGLLAGFILTAKQFWRKLFNSVGLFKKK